MRRRTFLGGAAGLVSRCEWLTSELPRLVRYGHQVERCPVCSDVELTAHCWPEVFSCRCSAVIVLDRWLPDDRERVLIRFPIPSDLGPGRGAQGFGGQPAPPTLPAS